MRAETRVGLIDGSVEADSRRFAVVLDPDAVVQLDELLVTSQALPDGRTVAHYGIVVESRRHIEGASFASDTVRIDAQTMPGEAARRVDVQVLRTDPELWLAPEPGMVVRRAAGVDRERALFLDQMNQPLPVGLDQSGQPVMVDVDFVSGARGGHVNISGVSGVATKTSYALFLAYMLTETAQGRALLGAHGAQTRLLVFNTKGQDLLYLDRPNARFAEREGAAAQWGALGVDRPGPFTDVELYAPPLPSREGGVVPDISGRPRSEVTAYGWTPWEFIRGGLLQFCFAAEEDRRTQVSFVEQQVRVQLARHAWPLRDGDGAVVLAPSAGSAPFDIDRVASLRRDPRDPGDGTVVRSFGDLVDHLERVLLIDEHPEWTGNTQTGTVQAFLRRLFALKRRLGHLVATGLTRVDVARAQLSVVDLSRLHDAAQRFVVGALLAQVWEGKQGTGREPLRFVVLDELNKYAPREGSSPLKELLVDVAERGRALGVLLIGAQQAATGVDPAIIRNAAVKVVGRLDAGEAAEYRFLTPELRERAARFLPGTMVLDQPLVPAPIPLRFPFPAFATNVDEGRESPEETHAAEEGLLDRARRR